MKSHLNINYKCFIAILISACIISFLSCEEINVDIEPLIEATDETNDIGDFDFTLSTPTDCTIDLCWSVAGNAKSYDIIINDTIRIKDLTTNYYTITDLEPNTSYKIVVRAISSSLHIRTIEKTIKTLEKPISEIYKIAFDKFEYSKYDFTNCIKTNDGNYIFLGDAEKYIMGYKLIVKTDKFLNILWKTEISTGIYFAYTLFHIDLKQCSDGGYLVITEHIIYKISASGQLLWENSDLKNQSIDMFNSAGEMSDGSYICIGTSARNKIPGIRLEYFLMKISSSGKTIWKKYAGTIASNIGSKVLCHSNGKNYLFGIAECYGIVGYPTSTPNNYSVLIFDNNGDVIKELFYKYANSAINKDILQTSDGNIYLIGSSFVNYGESYIVKINENGDFIWDRKGYDDGEHYAIVNAGTILTDNTLVFISYIDYDDYQIKELNSNGEIKSTLVLRDFFKPIFIDKDEQGCYILISNSGYLYRFQQGA